jgi:hypothetical protein
MDGLAPSDGARNLSDKALSIDVSAWGHAGGAAMDDTATPLAAHHRHCRGSRMRAALGAAGNVNIDLAGMRWQVSRDLGGECARRDPARSAGRPTGAGGDAAARVVRLHNEAESPG